MKQPEEVLSSSASTGPDRVPRAATRGQGDASQPPTSPTSLTSQPSPPTARRRAPSNSSSGSSATLRAFDDDLQDASGSQQQPRSIEPGGRESLSPKVKPSEEPPSVEMTAGPATPTVLYTVTNGVREIHIWRPVIQVSRESVGTVSAVLASFPLLHAPHLRVSVAYSWSSSNRQPAHTLLGNYSVTVFVYSGCFVHYYCLVILSFSSEACCNLSQAVIRHSQIRVSPSALLSGPPTP